MDPWFAFFLLVAVGVLAALVVLAVRLLPVIMQHFKGAPGGWSRLVAVYAATKPPSALVLHRQTLVVGRALYRKCVRVAVGEDGLYLQLGFPLSLLRRPPLLIPWKEFKRAEEARLQWHKAVLLQVGDPMVGTITSPMELFVQMRSHMSLGPIDAPSSAAPGRV